MAPVDVPYSGLAPVRVYKGALYVFTPMVPPPTCPGTGFRADISEEACRESASTLWRCVQQALAPRLDATPNPYAHPGAFSLATRTGDCQLELMEQQRLSLSLAERRPQATGQEWGLGFFTAVE